MSNDLKSVIFNSALKIAVSDMANSCVKNSINSISDERLESFIKEGVEKFKKNFEFQCQSNNLDSDLNLTEELISNLAIEFSNVYVRFNYANRLDEGMGVEYFNNSDNLFKNIASKYIDSYKKIYNIISLDNGNKSLDSENISDELNARLSLDAANLLLKSKYSGDQKEEVFVRNFLNAYQGIYKKMNLGNNDKISYDVLNMSDEAIGVMISSAVDVYISKMVNKFDYDTVVNNISDSMKKVIDQGRKRIQIGNEYVLSGDVLDSFESTSRSR